MSSFERAFTAISLSGASSSRSDSRQKRVFIFPELMSSISFSGVCCFVGAESSSAPAEFTKGLRKRGFAPEACERSRTDLTCAGSE